MPSYGSCSPSIPERTLIWVELRAARREMLRWVGCGARVARAGVSCTGVLVWSQGRSLVEVSSWESLVWRLQLSGWELS